MTSSLRIARVTFALGAALVLAACAAPSDPESTPNATPDASSSAPSAASAPAPSSDAPETAGVDTAGWQTITTPRGDATFQIPADWSTRDGSMETEQGFSTYLEILDADGGYELAYLNGPGDIGGACIDPATGEQALTTYETLESTPTSIESATQPGEMVQLVAWALQHDADDEDAGATFAMGLIDPERSDPGCLAYLLFSSPDAAPGLLSFGSHVVQVGPESGGGVWEVATMDDARAYVETDEYQMLRAILLSVAFPAS